MKRAIIPPPINSPINAGIKKYFQRLNLEIKDRALPYAFIPFEKSLKNVLSAEPSFGLRDNVDFELKSFKIDKQKKSLTHKSQGFKYYSK